MISFKFQNKIYTAKWSAYKLERFDGISKNYLYAILIAK